MVQKWLSVHLKTMKIRDIEELIKNMVQPIENIRERNFPFSENKAHVNFDVSENIENIRELKNQFSEYFIPDEYKIEGQTRSYKEYLNEIEYV